MQIIEIYLFSLLTLFNTCGNQVNTALKNLGDQTPAVQNETQLAESVNDKASDFIKKDIYDRDIKPAAFEVNNYIEDLKGKKIALCVNQTSAIGQVHLVDSLLNLGIDVKKIFAPEHGFRGKADAGEHVNNSIDTRTGIPIISLYGDHKKPTLTDLKDIDMIVFDIQDVGVRFYTFISTLTYVMEASAENNIPLLVLDRPNPNGHYVDGPVLENGFQSFVGMHNVPVVYGMTIGEYALMVNGEGWIQKPCDLKVVPCIAYNHKKFYQIPIAPSPNLKTMLSIYLYPSLGLFEGTPVSVGRGTDNPFEQYGYPDMTSYPYSFKPHPTDGAKDPLQNGKVCYGEDLRSIGELRIRMLQKVNLDYLQKAFNACNDKSNFFNNFFNKLAGNSILKTQIQNRMRETEIRKSWQEKLNAFKIIRKKYLLYEDFES